LAQNINKFKRAVISNLPLNRVTAYN